MTKIRFYFICIPNSIIAIVLQGRGSDVDDVFGSGRVTITSARADGAGAASGAVRGASGASGFGTSGAVVLASGDASGQPQQAHIRYHYIYRLIFLPLSRYLNISQTSRVMCGCLLGVRDLSSESLVLGQRLRE